MRARHTRHGHPAQHRVPHRGSVRRHLRTGLPCQRGAGRDRAQARQGARGRQGRLGLQAYAPNEYTVYLNPKDRERFSEYEASLRTELAVYLAEHARREGYVLTTRPRVLFETESALSVGEFGIACEHRRRPTPRRPRQPAGRRRRSPSRPRPAARAAGAGARPPAGEPEPEPEPETSPAGPRSRRVEAPIPPLPAGARAAPWSPCRSPRSSRPPSSSRPPRPQPAGGRRARPGESTAAACRSTPARLRPRPLVRLRPRRSTTPTPRAATPSCAAAATRSPSSTSTRPTGRPSTASACASRPSPPATRSRSARPRSSSSARPSDRAMTEQLLLALKVGFLVVLYLFVWRVDPPQRARPAGAPGVDGPRRGGRRGRRAGPGRAGAAAAAGHRSPAVVLSSPIYPPGHRRPPRRRRSRSAAQRTATWCSTTTRTPRRRHAQVFARDAARYVRDLGSTNGTHVDGQAIVAEHRLRPGDELRVGETELRYEE